MISGILSDALYNIERYQSDMPECYDVLKDEIEEVKLAMGRLRDKLEQIPLIDGIKETA